MIHGSEILTLREAIEFYCTESFDIEEYWKKRKTHFNNEEQKKALLFMKDIPNQLEKLRKQVVQGKKLYQKLEKCALKKNYSLEETKRILKKIKKINISLEKNCLAELIINGLSGVEYTLRTGVYQLQNNEQEDLIESAQIGQCFLMSMEIAIREIESEIIKLSEFQGEY